MGRKMGMMMVRVNPNKITKLERKILVIAMPITLIVRTTNTKIKHNKNKAISSSLTTRTSTTITPTLIGNPPSSNNTTAHHQPHSSTFHSICANIFLVCTKWYQINKTTIKINNSNNNFRKITPSERSIER